VVVVSCIVKRLQKCEKTAIQACKTTVVKYIQLERSNNHTLVNTRSKDTKQEEEHMLIVLKEQVHLASITR